MHLPSFARGRPRLVEAIHYSGCLHSDQRREADQAPFILHPLEVAAALDAQGAPDDVLIAAVLHDAVEATEAELADLERRFGARVGDLVRTVTEDDSIADWDERKAGLRARVAAAGDDAVLLFAADKLCKARELRLRREVPPQKLAHYELSLELAAAKLGEQPIVRLLRFELEALQALPPVG